MKILIIDDFFVTNIFYPFLMICLGLGLISIFLIFVHYIVHKIDEIKFKERSIDDAFSSIKLLYKKELILLGEILNDIKLFENLYGEHETIILQKAYDERYRIQKRLEKIHEYGKEDNSIKTIIELENSIVSEYYNVL